MADYLEFTYPFFVPNQALKSNDLNRIVAYLGQQDRLTRVYLIGAGIFYGLEPSFQGGGLNISKLNISKGAGVSSEGYLFVLKEAVSYTGWIWSTLTSAQFNGIASNAPSFQVLEFTSEVPANLPKDEAGNTIPFNEETIQSKAIVLLIDNQQIERKACVNSCDGKGSDVDVKIRVFAIDPVLIPDPLHPDKKYLYNFWLCPQNAGGLAENAYFPCIRRLNVAYAIVPEGGQLPGPLPLDEMMEPADLYLAWNTVIADAISANQQSLPKALANAIAKIPGAPDQAIISQQITDTLTQLYNAAAGSTNPNVPQLQYLYDHLVDLAAAYDELKKLAPEQADTWDPDETCFPRFISLGTTEKAADGHLLGAHRMKLYRPKLPGFTNDVAGQLNLLTKRLADLLSNRFQLSPLPNQKDVRIIQPDVRITASGCKSLPLSKRAIPYYYKDREALKKDWNYELLTTGRTDGIQSYEELSLIVNADTGTVKVESLPVPPRQLLTCGGCAYDFFRVEGHLGSELSDGFKSILYLRTALNLPFTLTAVRLGGVYKTTEPPPVDPEFGEVLDQLTFHTFAARHPGLEHCGGVPKGGTFILVYGERFTDPRKEIEVHTLEKNTRGLEIQINKTQQAIGAWEADLKLIQNDPEKKKRLEALVENGKRELGQLQERLVKYQQRREILVEAFVEHFILADFCLPYSCFKAPMVEYKFVETGPVAEFVEVSRQLKADQLEITFQNKSKYAQSFKWTLTPRDGTAPSEKTTDSLADTVMFEIPANEYWLGDLQLEAFAEALQTGISSLEIEEVESKFPIADFEVQQLYYYDDGNFADIWLENRSLFYEDPIDWYLQTWENNAWVPANFDPNNPPAPTPSQPKMEQGSNIVRPDQWYHKYKLLDGENRVRVWLRATDEAGQQNWCDQVIELDPAVEFARQQIVADFAEISRTTGADGMVTIELGNRSINARSYRWSVEEAGITLISAATATNATVEVAPDRVTKVRLKAFRTTNQFLPAASTAELEIRTLQAVPTPDFAEIKRVSMGENEGWIVTFENRSSGAASYFWEITPVNPSIDPKTSDSADDTVEFHFDTDELLESLEWQVKLYASVTATATNTDPSATAILRFCPPKIIFEALKSTEPAKNALTIDFVFDENMVIEVKRSPLGGQFYLDDNSIVPTQGAEQEIAVFTFGNATPLRPNLLAPGTHILKYAFADCDTPAALIMVTVLPPGAPPVNRDAVPPPPSLTALLNRRRTQYSANCDAVGDKKLAATASFRRVQAFLLSPPGNLDKTTETFDELAKLLLASSARSGGASAAQYAVLLHNVTWYFLDKLVVESPEAVFAPALGVLRTVVPAMQQAGSDLVALRDNWQGDALKNGGNDTTIENLQSLLLNNV